MGTGERGGHGALVQKVVVGVSRRGEENATIHPPLTGVNSAQVKGQRVGRATVNPVLLITEVRDLLVCKIILYKKVYIPLIWINSNF